MVNTEKTIRLRIIVSQNVVHENISLNIVVKVRNYNVQIGDGCSKNVEATFRKCLTLFALSWRKMRWFPSQLPHMISRWSSLFKSVNAIPRPFSLLTRISVSSATSTKVSLVRPFLIPHLLDWRKMEVCLINCNTGDWWELFKIVQYLVMECNCVMKITEGLFRKYSTL